MSLGDWPPAVKNMYARVILATKPRWTSVEMCTLRCECDRCCLCKGSLPELYIWSILTKGRVRELEKGATQVIVRDDDAVIMNFTVNLKDFSNRCSLMFLSYRIPTE